MSKASKIQDSAREFFTAHCVGNISPAIEDLKSLEKYWEAYARLVDIRDEDGELVEVLGFWSVDNVMARELRRVGESISMEFPGINVWARTTSGQSPYMDEAIMRIVQDK